jgi:hypothetical protein
VFSSSRVVASLHLRLLDGFALAVVVLSIFRRSLLRALSAFAALLSLLWGGATFFTVSLVGRSITALLAAVESTGRLFELGEAVGDGLRGAVCDSC